MNAPDTSYPGPRLFVVVGTRPEAIKLGPVIGGARSRGWPVCLCSTGQHSELLDAALSSFALVPDIRLGLMRPGQQTEEVLGRAVPALAEAIGRTRPDLVVVQGDTVSAFAGALAAFYRHVPVAHVEAGLRSGQADDPFPEEMHRREIARLADLHFAATQTARHSLLEEGVSAEAVTVTGNSGIDALHLTLAAIDHSAMNTRFEWFDRGRPLVLATIHRRENQDGRLAEIVQGFRRIAMSGRCQLAVTVHPAPRIKAALRTGLAGCPDAVLLDPVDHPTFVWLLTQAALVLTDSGGVQEEAPALGCPTLVLRRSTERPEGIATGNARLVDVTADAIELAVASLLDDAPARRRMAEPASPYGDGCATERILAEIARWWALRAGRTVAGALSGRSLRSARP